MRKIFTIIISLLTTTTTCLASTAEEFVLTMRDETAGWEARCKAEDSLAILPPQKVLPALLPHIREGMPSSVIWNSGGREFDKNAPVEWQIFYAISRSWDHQVESLPRDTGGTILLTLLDTAKAANARRQILTALTRRWVGEAEIPVAALLKTPGEDFAVRTTAALALIQHGVGNYHAFFLNYAQTGTFTERKRWFDLLSDPRHKKRTGLDSCVAQMGFALILENRTLYPEDVHGAYFLSVAAGDYVGQVFAPDRKASRYQGTHGLTDAFFADTVKNAMAWWTKHKS